jgi:aspartyl-tRNA(Asn)/glutamyl-tRNA(Gln) amidotransferase subunit B
MADYFEACLGEIRYYKEFREKYPDKRGDKRVQEALDWLTGKQISEGAKEVSNWILGETSRILNANNIEIDQFREKVSPEQLRELIVYSHGRINLTTAKAVLDEMFKTGKPALEIISQRGLSQISDSGELEATIVDVINSNAQAVSDYKAGKDTALKFLVGQVMRTTKGRANPVLAGELLKKKLDEG